MVLRLLALHAAAALGRGEAAGDAWGGPGRLRPNGTPVRPRLPSAAAASATGSGARTAGRRSSSGTWPPRSLGGGGGGHHGSRGLRCRGRGVQDVVQHTAAVPDAEPEARDPPPVFGAQAVVVVGGQDADRGAASRPVPWSTGDAGPSPGPRRPGDRGADRRRPAAAHGPDGSPRRPAGRRTCPSRRPRPGNGSTARTRAAVPSDRPGARLTPGPPRSRRGPRGPHADGVRPPWARARRGRAGAGPR